MAKPRRSTPRSTSPARRTPRTTASRSRSRTAANGGALPLPKLSLGLSPEVVRSLVGILLLGVATTLPYGRAWAWAIAALGALAALALIAATWLMSGAGDWPGALLALPAVVLSAAPSVRELYLND